MGRRLRRAIAPMVVVFAIAVGLCALVIIFTATSAAAASGSTPPIHTTLGAFALLAALVTVAVALAAVAQFVRMRPRYRRQRRL